MKFNVLCINTGGNPLTIGKWYISGYEADSKYRIEGDDNGFLFWYDRSLFKTIEQIRNEKLNKLLDYEDDWW